MDFVIIKPSSNCAWFYILSLNREGIIRVGEYSTLAANYLLKRLEAIGCQAAYPERRASHEFILTFAKQAKDNHVTALDIAKRLLDYNQHTPSIYFPLLVPEWFLIEPTETETVTEAPIIQPVRRLDEWKRREN